MIIASDGEEVPYYPVVTSIPTSFTTEPTEQVLTIPFPVSSTSLAPVLGLYPTFHQDGYGCRTAFHPLWNVDSSLFQPANRCAKVNGLFIQVPSFTMESYICVPRSSVPGESYRKGWHLFSLERGFARGLTLNSTLMALPFSF